jgi:hypothetical protein
VREGAKKRDHLIKGEAGEDGGESKEAARDVHAGEQACIAGMQTKG